MARLQIDEDEDISSGEIDVDVDDITFEGDELETLVKEYIEDNPHCYVDMAVVPAEPTRATKSILKSYLGLREWASDADMIREFSDLISKCI